MPIPYGLLGQTDIEKKKRGPFKPGEGYWLGSQYIFPELPPTMPGGMNPAPAMPPAGGLSPAQQPQGGVLGPGMETGDGGAGNGVGGGPVGGQVAPEVQEQGIPAGYGLGIVSPVSVEPVAPAPTSPAPGLAPAPGLQDLAVTEVDPQGPSGKSTTGKSHGMNTGMNKSTPEEQAANQAAAQAVAEAQGLGRATMDKAIQEKGLIDAFKDAMQATAATAATGMVGVTAEQAGHALGARQERSNDLPGVSVAFADHPSVTGKGSAGGGSSSGNGVGTGSATSGTGPNAGDEGGLGAWRDGGPVPDDGDETLEPVRGILHEREFVLRPEAAQYYGKGILGALNAKAIPKAKLSGLLRL